MATPVTHLGQRRELFVEDSLIAGLTGKASLRLHQPVAREIALVCDRPWEGNMCGGYKTYFHDGKRFRMYYQCWHGDYYEEAGKTKLRSWPIRIGYLESADGIHWERPNLGLLEFQGSKANNICFEGYGPDQIGVHGFAPMLDSNPACPPAARYKALGANGNAWPLKLYAMQSPDGLSWSLMQPEPVLTKGTFDSQNLAFWDSERGEYRCYLRHVTGKFFRGIWTCTSPDFITWSDPVPLHYPGAPEEQLYTNQVMPYPRAPHLLVGFPTRYVERPWSPTVEALPELEHRQLRARISQRYGSAVTDGLFMASRDRLAFKRWDEAFIRPGLRPTGNWCYGDNYQGWGLLETATDIPGTPPELSVYASEGYWRGNANAFRRFTLRQDGFVSLHAPLGGGELLTQPLTFSGQSLTLNLATSGGGGARVEFLTADGNPIAGFTTPDCTELVGDDLALRVRFTGQLASLAGHPIRLRFHLRDADLYSYCFA